MSSVRSATSPGSLRDHATLFAPLPLWEEDAALVASDLPNDRGFAAMRAAFRATGGLARADDLARLLDDRRGVFPGLATLIDSGDGSGFEWRDVLWVPMFQFELRDLSIKQRSRQVLAELPVSYDGWVIAAWFVRPNSWLNERRPVDLLDSNLPALLDAARADRFVALG